MPDEELKIPRTDPVEQYKTDKFLNLEGELPKFDLENQEYMKMIEKLCCIEKNICVNDKKIKRKTVKAKRLNTRNTRHTHNAVE